MLSQRQKNKIIEAYQKGDRVDDICLNLKLTHTKLYYVLNQARIPLRSTDPNHPASPMAVRNAAGKEKETKPPISETPFVEIQSGTVPAPATSKIPDPPSKEKPTAYAGKEDVDSIITRLALIETHLIEMDNTIDCIANPNCMDRKLKIDIVEAFMKTDSTSYTNRERAKKLLNIIVNIIEAINGV